MKKPISREDQMKELSNDFPRAFSLNISVLKTKLSRKLRMGNKHFLSSYLKKSGAE